jgi:hypothetical protein
LGKWEIRKLRKLKLVVRIGADGKMQDFGKRNGLLGKKGCVL